MTGGDETATVTTIIIGVIAMETYYSTRQVSKCLGVRPDMLQKAIWQGRLDAPEKSPSGNYLWTTEDINRASWQLLHKAYEPAIGGVR